MDELREERDVPVIIADDEGLIVYVNGAFEEALGWGRDEVVGRPITILIPPAFRDAHHLGFARFMATERSALLGRPLALPALTRDGREIAAEHLIVAERRDGRWVFGATIRPGSRDG